MFMWIVALLMLIVVGAYIGYGRAPLYIQASAITVVSILATSWTKNVDWIYGLARSLGQSHPVNLLFFNVAIFIVCGAIMVASACAAEWATDR
ncbi:MAG: hypothetical protein ACREGR_00670 [Minisyncoccia bacterium]